MAAIVHKSHSRTAGITRFLAVPVAAMIAMRTAFKNVLREQSRLLLGRGSSETGCDGRPASSPPDGIWAGIRRVTLEAKVRARRGTEAKARTCCACEAAIIA